MPQPGRVFLSGLISTSKAQVLDGAESGSSRWLGDREVEILIHLLSFDRFSPVDLVPHFCKDRKSAYVYVQRLVRKGFVEKVARGVYRVIRNKVESILRSLPKVRAISRGRRKAGVRQPEGTGAPSTAAPVTVAVPAAGRPTVGASAVSYPLRVSGVSGPLLDNLRFYDSEGCFRVKPRGEVWRLEHLASVDVSRVSYLEVAFLLGGHELPGNLVLYSDPGRFPGAVKVEWRPPRGFVRRSGVAGALSMAREVYVTGFRALARVLAEVLPRPRLVELAGWLSRVWGVCACP